MGHSRGTNYSHTRLALALALAACAPKTAHAVDLTQAALSPLALFNRCYGHITGKALPINHPLRASVVAGTLSPVDACMQIFDKATLQGPGMTNEGYLSSDTTEGRAVLRNFNDFHRSWFPTDTFEKAVTLGDKLYSRSAQLHDQTEAALHVTRVLFTPGVNYSAVVTESSGMEALRTGGPSNYESTLTTNSAKLQMYLGSTATAVPINAQLLQTGELLGARKISLNSSKANQTSSTLVSYVDTYVPVHASQGGGIIGTASYLILNLGRLDMQTMNGGVRMPRRWAKSLLKDLMCRDLPALRLLDAVPFVQTTATASTPPFRLGSTCMSCHASIDPISATARNLSYIESYYPASNGVILLRPWAVTQPPESGVVEDDPKFHQRPPNGTLFYRSYNGDLINVPVNGVAALGNALSQTEDLYVCAASRYFEYFTGIRANLQDNGDPANPQLSAADQTYRNIVVQLGLSLKANPNLRDLIKSILSSPLYQTNSMRALGP